MSPPALSASGADLQVDRVMKLAREYLKTPSSTTTAILRGRAARARSKSPSRGEGLRPKTCSSSPQRTNRQSKNNINSNSNSNSNNNNTMQSYSEGASALFALQSKSYSSAAMADIMGKMSNSRSHLGALTTKLDCTSGSTFSSSWPSPGSGSGSGSSPPQKQKQKKRTKFHIGETVEASRKASKLFRSAKIRRIHSDNTYDLLWVQTGDKEAGVARVGSGRNRLRRLRSGRRTRRPGAQQQRRSKTSSRGTSSATRTSSSAACPRGSTGT